MKANIATLIEGEMENIKSIIDKYDSFFYHKDPKSQVKLMLEQIKFATDEIASYAEVEIEQNLSPCCNASIDREAYCSECANEL